MKTLLNVLTKIPISKKEAESVLTELDYLIESKVNKAESKMIKETIQPILKENDGIRSEIRLLTETMKHGFDLVNERFEKMDQKMDFIRENLEIQIKTNKESIDRQLALQQKLIWGVLSVVLGLLAKSILLR
jgi:hypothetical protein